MSDILKARVAKLEQDSKQPQNDSPFEKAFNIPESVAVQLKKHTPFEENMEPEVYQKVCENLAKNNMTQGLALYGLESAACYFKTFDMTNKVSLYASENKKYT
ncbi:unnamed protein product [Rhizophagus irregularis]|nr:unnamed protein product [Rhizophagus irregularis]